MTWHEANRLTTRRGMVRMVLGHQADVYARSGHVHRVSFRPANQLQTAGDTLESIVGTDFEAQP